ncbi:hypothetical protein [Streptomyces canus]
MGPPILDPLDLQILQALQLDGRAPARGVRRYIVVLLVGAAVMLKRRDA